MTIRKLEVSLATFNEIAGILERSGAKINSGDSLTIDKSDKLIPPVDFRLVTIRRDVASLCASFFKMMPEDKPEKFVDFVKETYNYVLNGDETPQEKTDE